MELRKSYLLLCLMFSLSVFHSASANEKIADLMGNIADQVAELTALSKLVPQDVLPRVFTKAKSRCRVARIMFAVLDEKKGSLDASGALVAAEMTPDKFATIPAPDLEDFIKQYSAALSGVSGEFQKIEAELDAQQTMVDTTQRDFTGLKALLTQLNTSIRAAHRLFR